MNKLAYLILFVLSVVFTSCSKTQVLTLQNEHAIQSTQLINNTPSASYIGQNLAINNLGNDNISNSKLSSTNNQHSSSKSVLVFDKVKYKKLVSQRKEKYNQIFSLKNKYHYFTAGKLKNIEASSKGNKLEDMAETFFYGGMCLIVLCLLLYLVVYALEGSYEWVNILFYLAILISSIGCCLYGISRIPYL